VNEVAGEYRPEELEERALTPPKSSDIKGERSRAFEQTMVSQSAFCDEQNFHSIVIIAPLYVSKSSRVLKKLTASAVSSGELFEPETITGISDQVGLRRSYCYHHWRRSL
jgi:hypothetical protein